MRREEAGLDEIFSATYEELRRLASRVKAGDASATLNPTALVNEAYARLANAPGVRPTSRLHFKRIAARAMRQILVEAARRRASAKRGGDAPLVRLDDALDGAVCDTASLLALDELLEELAIMSARQALLVEHRVFGGYEMSEIAEMLRVSESTIHRDWRAARAWLSVNLKRRKR